MTPRAITGLGVLSALGIGREAVFSSLREGSLPNERVTVFDRSTLAVASCHGPPPRTAEIPDFDPSRFLGDKGLRSLDRQTKLLVVAARLALHDAGLKKDGAFVALGPDRVGLCASNAYGSLESIVELDRVAVLEDPRYINPAKFPNTVANSASGYVSIWEELRALNVAVSDGNAGALDTITCADIYLETGRAEAIVVGGGEALSEPLYVAFERLGRLVRESLLSEGAALFVLETVGSAQKRSARVDALVLGTGNAFEPPLKAGALLHASDAALKSAIDQALQDAGVAAGDVDLVVSGVGQAGAFADAELRAIAQALGDKVPVAVPKHVFGETFGASGALGMCAALAWLQGVPVRTLVRGAAPAAEAVRKVVVTTLGFYGNASAVVLGNPTPRPAGRRAGGT